jgi:peptidyl-prolyl cis-trans isomerase SurA
MSHLFLFLTALAISSGAVLVDRIAVIVGKHVIKLSDVDRDLRVTAFLNRQTLDLTGAMRRKAAERLVDQQLIRQDLSAQGYARATDADANALLQQILRDRFAGSETQLDGALARYGLTKDLLQEQLLWQITVLRFIDERFRPGVLVTDEEIEAYYNEHLSELRREYSKDSRLETLSGKIKTSIEGTRIDQAYDSWLEQARKRNRIEYKEAAFQ